MSALARSLLVLLRSFVVCSGFVLAQPNASAQDSSNGASTVKADAAAVVPGTSAALLAASGASARVSTPGMPDGLASQLAANSARMTSLEETVAKASESAGVAARRSFWLALATILVAALNQWGLFWHQRVLRREDAADEISKTYVDWQLKQITELYGPLRALLGQSNAMYRQMNKALAAARPEQFRLERKEGGDFDNFVFQINKNGNWTQFRTVRDLGAVYNQGLKIEPYFDAVVKAGRRMAKLIEDKAGYARPDDKELVKVMGVYLAHYSVLSRLHRAAKDNKPVEPTVGDLEATFPLEIQDLVNKGFNVLNEEVMAWRKRAQGN